MRVTCTVVSFFWHYRYYLLMPQLTMHSLGIGATISPETLHVRAILPRRVTTPTKLIATRGLTVHSYYVTKPNGAKLNTAGTTRHRFDRPLTVMADWQLRSTFAARVCGDGNTNGPSRVAPSRARGDSRRPG